jgi:Fic family protein
MNNLSIDKVLQLAEPEFKSELNGSIVRLEVLRHQNISSKTVRPFLFFELQSLFHLIESVQSARIEGNRTTLAEAVEKTVSGELEAPKSEGIREIKNLYKAFELIEKNIKANTSLSKEFIHSLHKTIVEGLSNPDQVKKGEGDPHPGEYRKVEVGIEKSNLQPPPRHLVPMLMDELIEFINAYNEGLPQYCLLKTAVAHHRFTWIHPYRNGNGRVARLVTYTELIKEGFRVHLLNPTAVFCADRNKYFDMLGKADTWTREGIQEWCLYFLSNLGIEMENVNRLLDIDFLLEKIIFPSLQRAEIHYDITPEEHKILRLAFKLQKLKANDIRQHLIPNASPAKITRMIKALRDKKMLIPEEGSERIYRPAIFETKLMYGICFQLSKEGMNPIKD